MCGSAVGDVTASAYGTVAVYDAGGGDIDNLEGLSRVVSLAGSTAGIEVGAALGLVFPVPLQINLHFNEIGGTAWKQQLQAWGDQVKNMITNLDDVLEWFIPAGANGAVSIGLGMLPANGSGSLCYTLVRKTLCLREHGGGRRVPRSTSSPQPSIRRYPPATTCRWRRPRGPGVRRA